VQIEVRVEPIDTPMPAVDTRLLAQDLVLDIDDRDRIAGVWLLNVPPFPIDQ
jgi:hypothetical protein